MRNTSIILETINVFLILSNAIYMIYCTCTILKRAIGVVRFSRVSIMIGSAFMAAAVGYTIQFLNVSRFYYLYEVPLKALIPFTFQNTLMLYSMVVGGSYSARKADKEK